MLKSWQYLACVLFTSATLAAPIHCPDAVDSGNPAFCASFQQVALCHCIKSGLPSSMCNSMKFLYERMISTFGSTDRACRFQHDTRVEVCLEAWQCYLYGGTNSKNELCSGTGNACEAI